MREEERLAGRGTARTRLEGRADRRETEARRPLVGVALWQRLPLTGSRHLPGMRWSPPRRGHGWLRRWARPCSTRSAVDSSTRRAAPTLSWPAGEAAAGEVAVTHLGDILCHSAGGVEGARHCCCCWLSPPRWTQLAMGRARRRWRENRQKYSR